MDLALRVNIKTDDIISGCVKGDRLQQKRLYELYYPKMMGICMRYTNDREEARDVLNEGFMKVFLNLHKYKPENSLESWIRRIMINNSIDHYRKNKKLKANVPIEAAYNKSHPATAVSVLATEELLGLVQKLPPSYKVVFNLYVVEGYNHREIGEKLGISEGTSKSNLSKARLKLQAMINAMDL